MNKHLLGIVGLFAFAWLAIVIYAVSGSDVKIPFFEIDLKKTDASEFLDYFSPRASAENKNGIVKKSAKGRVYNPKPSLLSDSAASGTFLTDTANVNLIDSVDELYNNNKELALIGSGAVKGVMDTTKQRFLFFGDSMQEGLIRRWTDYCRNNGHEVFSVIWYSSSTKDWGSCDTLSYFIRKHKPTYIVCVLGANELYVRNIKKSRADFVANIIKQAGNTKFIWIGPPNWREDTGINELIAQNMEPGSFFLTKGMKFNRISDGAHPTYESAYLWADSIARWITRSSIYPVKLKKPEMCVNKAPKTTILKFNR